MTFSSIRKFLIVSALATTAPAGLTSAYAQDSAAYTLEQPAAGTYALDATHAALFWSVRHNNVSNYTARFDKIEGKLVLDPVNIEKSSVEVTIDPASVQVGFPFNYRETHADAKYDTWGEAISKDPQMLNSTAFPKITFKSTAVTKTGETTADVVGDLTLLGVTKAVTLKANLIGALESHPFAGTPVVAFTAEGKFDRTEFGQPVGFSGTEVTVRFDGEFVQNP